VTTCSESPLPPLLQDAHTQEFKASTVDYLKELWNRNELIVRIDGIPFGPHELKRLLHFRGDVAYINDNIVDALAHLMNKQEGDFWILPSHLYGKYMISDPIDRWMNRAKKSWAKKLGDAHIPKHLFLPFAVGLHYRVIVWDTHRDRVVYLDPFNPVPSEPEQCWMNVAINLCGKMRQSWSIHDLPPPAYGMELPNLPVQVDGVSCGLYIVVYMLMMINNGTNVVFPPEGTTTFRVIVAWFLGRAKFPFRQLQKILSAEVTESNEEA